MGHGVPCSKRSCTGIHCFLRAIGFDRVVFGCPLGVEDHIGGRHGHGVQVSLGTLIATGCSVPAIEHIGVLFQIGRIFWLKIVAAQRRFVLYTAALTVHICIVVVEFQVVAIAGVAEVVVRIDSVCFSPLLHLTERRIRPPLSKSRNIMEFFSIGKISRLLNVYFFVKLEIFPAVCIFSRLPIQCFDIVPNNGSGFTIVPCKRNIFAGHGVNAAQLRTRLKGLAAIWHIPPNGVVYVLYREIAMNICLILGGDGQIGSFVTAIAVAMF